MKGNATFIKRLSAVTAATAALALALSGCGGGNGGKTAEGGAGNSTKEQPVDGFPASWQGAYPMPSKDKAYNNPQKRDAIKDGGTLNMAVDLGTDNWNYLSNDGNTGGVSEMWSWYMPSTLDLTFDGQASYNKDYITKAEVTKQDPMTITYDINPKAKWNDGSAIDWTAFESTWKVQNGKDPNYNPPATDGYQDIAKVEQGTSAKQAVVTFEKPFNPWISLFGSLYNPKAADPKTFGQGWVNNPHSEWGAGPFKVTKYDQNGVTFERNENWWGEKPKLDKVVYRFMDMPAQLTAFKNSEIDVVTDAVSANNDLKTVQGRKDAQIRVGYAKKTRVMQINGKSKQLSDINVRKAVAMTVDTKQIADIQFQGLNWQPDTAGSEIFPSFQEGYQDNRPEDMRKANPEGAKKVLESDGYKMGSDGYYAKDGKVLELNYVFFVNSPDQVNTAKAVQQMLKGVGIKINIDQRDTSKFTKTLNSHDFDLVPMAWGMTSPFGQNTVAQLYGSESPSNVTQLGNKEIDDMAKVPATISDSKKAIEAANKAESKALALYGSIPTVVPPAYNAVKKGLANFGPAGFLTVHAEDIGWQK